MECIQLSLFGKTCQELLVPTEEKTSEPCWKSLPAWNGQTLLFLDLRGGADGAKRERSLEMDGLWLGDSLTANIGECPREENESLLSWILQADAPERYYLSAKACKGILTRASRRGKKLPELLRTALLEMIEWQQIRASVLPEMQLTDDMVGTLRANAKGHDPIVFDARGNGDGRIVPTITGDHESRITDYTAIAVEHAGCLTPWDVQSRRIFSEYGKWPALYSGEGGGHGYVFTLRWIVRRLTPMECERLQGYPDGWTDIGEWADTKGKKHKAADSPRYKALGNSIALPQWFWIVQKMKPYMRDGAKLGSLFDGIGGFPLVWETTYGEGTARWASEIEEFPIAVTKKHFPEKETKK